MAPKLSYLTLPYELIKTANLANGPRQDRANLAAAAAAAASTVSA